MSDNIERQKELSKRVLIPGEPKSAEQRTSNQIQRAPKQLVLPFTLGAIVGFFIFVFIWIASGFSKLAIMLPFFGGIFGIAIEMIRRKYKI